MLARLTTTNVLRGWDVRVEASMTTLSVHEDEDFIILDLAALRRMLPLPDTVWQRAASMYGRTVTPICRNFQNMINYDLECITQVLSDLEPPCISDESDEYADDSCKITCPMNLQEDYVEPEPSIPGTSPELGPRRRPFGHGPFVLKSRDSSIPTIIITPPCQEEHEGYCRIPLQNSAFHSQLTVPKHPAFNHIHPPLALTSYSSPVISHWRWRDGHWHAVVPSLEEQGERRLFSKALVTKKRTWRTRLRPQ